MKKVLKKVLSVMLVVVIMLTAAPLSGFVGLELPDWLDFTIVSSAAVTSGTCGDNLTWSYDDSTYVLTISGAGAMTNYSYSYRPWKSYEDSIKTVVIEDGVTAIGRCSFYSLGSLISVTIPNSVTSIGDYAFAFCDTLTSVIIPDSVTTIGGWAFSNCNNLTSITIPDSITAIGTRAFLDCDSITSITVDSNNQFYSNDEYGVLFNKDKTTLIKYPVGNTRTNYTIPDSVTAIDYAAFGNCSSLTSVIIPNGVTTIGSSAFSNCINFASITIPDSVITIDKYAFYHCTNLTGVTIPDSVTSIGIAAFAYCESFTSITISESVTSIGNGAFGECDSLTDVYYGGTEKQWNEISIDDGNAPLLNATIHFNSSSGDIPDDDDITSDKTGTCGDNLTWSFNESTNTLTISGTGAMYDYDSPIQPWESYKNKIEKVVINNGVTTIGTAAFEFCEKLDSVIIPNSVTIIDFSAFSNCSKLSNVVIPDSVTTIESWVFYDCDSLTSIIIPNSIKEIHSEAFYDCDSLDNVIIGNNVTYIGMSVFESCDSLTSITIPDSVTSIGMSTFSQCSALEGVSIGNGLEFIDRYVFSSCDKLINITIGNNVTAIGRGAFSRCSSLKSVIIPDSVTEIYDGAFSACSSLMRVTLPSKVTSIAIDTFSGCKNLMNVVIPEGVASIGTNAFNNCNSLADVYYLGTEKQWSSIEKDTGNDPLLSATIHFNSSSGDIPDDDDITSDKTGTCGDNLTWSLDSNGVLTISGTGDMYNCSDSLGVPWIDYRNSISSIVIGEGVTSIGAYAFNYCMNCTSVSIPNTVTSIGNYAFDTCTSLTSVTIPVSVISIGDYAFYNCIKVTDVYYLGTEKQWNRTDIGIGNVFTTATMHFAHEKDRTCYIAGRKFDDNFDHYTTYWDSSEYNAELANMLAALSVAAYDEIKIKSAYQSLGFDFDIDNDLYDYDGEFDSSRCGYSLKFKESDCNDDMICLISVRGSSNTSDWHSNFYITTFDEENHYGFYNPALNIYNNIQSILKSNNIKKDVKYILTGHSRGAAVANLLSVILMEEGVPSSNVYNYNFACPDVACKTYFTNYYNIFNLCNRADVVPHFPSDYANSFTNTTSGAKWDKYGQTYWFTKKAENSFAAHSSSLYLEYFDKQLYPEEWEGNYLDKYDTDYKLFYGLRLLFSCPVDVIVTVPKGVKIASVINGETNYYDSVFGDVVIITDGDKKIIYINGENDFNVELIGTDTGTMTYSVEKCNLASGEIYESKTYSDVTLENGKTMYSPVSEAESTNDIQLFVTEEKDGERVYTNIINEDGTEEKYYNYTFSIQTPSRTEIRHKDGIKLHANVVGEVPKGSYVSWSADNNKFKTEEINNGNSLKIVSNSNGYTTFTATLYSEDGEILATDTIEMKSKAGFFDKIGSFFRSIFGGTKIYEN